MKSQDFQAEIASLELRLAECEVLFDQSFQKNEGLAKAKAIFREIKKISDRLAEIRGINDGS
jgi:hypothetical protein